MLANAAIKELKASHGEDEKELAVYKEWNVEATALRELSDLSHPHMIQVRAIITKGRQHYFMFQWADGGCLRDFYRKNPTPDLNSGFVKGIVIQMEGLVSAIKKLHNYKESEESYRHGDLKPENILIFENDTPVGIWKVADMGLAKHHYAPTMLRGDQTTTRYGTPSYEPPEAENPQGPRSRLYDIWSMGCITLELILWLLYGYEWLLKFNNSLKVIGKNGNPYWMMEGEGSDKTPRIHPSVEACMKYIATKDPECKKSTVIKDLLNLVRTRLLVVNLPKDSKTFASPTVSELSPNVPVPSLKVPTLGPTINLPGNDRLVREPVIGPVRAKAIYFLSQLEKFVDKGEKDAQYWFSGETREGVAPPPILPPPGSNYLTPQTPRMQIKFADRTKNARQATQDPQNAQGGPSGLHAPPQKPDVGEPYLS